METPKELLDLVDQTDQKIGTITRGEVVGLFTATGKYVRYANCFLQNARGELWVPRRAAHKKIAPNGLDFSASEHVKSGEDYLSAALRGLREELFLKTSKDGITLIGKLTPAPNRPYFSAIFVIKQQAAPTFNPDDFVGYEWLTPAALVARLTQGAAAKDDLLPAAMLLQ